MNISICNMWSINNVGFLGLNWLYTKYYRLTTNWLSTTVERSLQIAPFMQNKPNFRKSQMNVNKVLTKDYENKTLGGRGKKQSQTKPIKANLLNAQMNVTVSYTTNYENKPPIWAPKKQSQFSKRQKPMQTFLPKRIMKETRFWVRTKQTQYEANQTQFQRQKMLLRMKINPRCKSLGYYADEIEAPNAYDRAVVGCRLPGAGIRGGFYLIVGAAWPIIDCLRLRI